MAVKEVIARFLKAGNTDGKNGWQCSRYSAYLATGKKTVFSKAHPDYGPVNGSGMVNYLIKNYGWEKCKKEDGAIFSIPVLPQYGIPYGHTGAVKNAKKNEVNDANWAKPLTVGNHIINLEKLGATYCRPKAKKTTAKKTETKKATTTFKVGDKVTLKKFVDTSGTALLNVSPYYVVDSISGERVVLRTARGGIYAVVKKDNLKKG